MASGHLILKDTPINFLPEWLKILVIIRTRTADMIQLPLENDTSLAFDPSGALSPVKPGPISIDLSELFSSKTAFTPSSLSGYDEQSVKTDEDNIKPLGIMRFSTQASESDALLEIASVACSESKITLGDIISKRSYTRRPKVEILDRFVLKDVG